MMRRARIAAILAGLTVAGVSAAPAGAVIPEGNLLANPGAEAGPGATGFETVPPPGWTTTATFTAVAYGVPDFPTLADSAALGGGANLFAGGSTNTVATASQTVDVSAAAPEIDGTGALLTVGAQLGGFSSQGDNTTITAVYRDGTGRVLGSTGAGPVTPAERNNVTELQQRTTAGTVPPGTRSIVVTLTATWVEGSYNDGFADNASLTLTPPPQIGETVTAGVASGLIYVREQGESDFHQLVGSESIPVGSSVDATDGTVWLNSATEGGGEQTFFFYEGRFNAEQSGDGLVTANLEGADFGSCKGKRISTRGKKNKKLARLWGSGGGRARTKGRRGSGTVRGTLWLTQERCDGTLFKVKEGVVKVRDFERKRNVTLEAGDKYLAKKR